MEKRNVLSCLLLLTASCVSLFNCVSYASETEESHAPPATRVTSNPYVNGGMHIINKGNLLDWAASPYYGGFASGENEKDVDLLVRGKSSPSERIYLGSKSGVLTGNLKLTIDTNDTSYYPFYHIYGGNGEVTNSAHIGNSEIVINSGYAARGWVTGSGRGDKRGNSTVIVNGGQIGEENYVGQAEIYGGPAETGSYQTGNTLVAINGGRVYQHILGGSSAGATLVGDTKVQVNQGAVFGHILGGSGGGAQPNQHTGNTLVEINGGVIDPVTGSNGGNIYGGSYGPNQNISGNTNVIINSGQDNNAYIKGSVYGGSHYQLLKGAGAISGNTNVQVHSGLIKDSVYGGGETSNVISGDTNVSVSSGEILGNVYGGGKSNIKGNSFLTISNGTIGKNVYGGNYNNTLDTNAYSKITGGTLGGSLYSGNYMGKVIGHAEAVFSGGQINGDLIGGSSSTSGTTGSSELIILDGAVSGHIIAASGKISEDGRITFKNITKDTSFINNYDKPLVALADKSTAGTTTVRYDHTQATVLNSFGTIDNPFTNSQFENHSAVKLTVVDKEYWAQNWSISSDSSLAFAREAVLHSNNQQTGMMKNAGKIDFKQSDSPFAKLTAEMSYTPIDGSKLIMGAETAENHNEFHISGNASGESTMIDLDLAKEWNGERIDLVFANEDSSDEAFQMMPISTNKYVATLHVRTENGKKIWYIDKKLRVYYDGNGHTSGEEPMDETHYAEGHTPEVQHSGSLEKEGAYFDSWNTKVDGSGKKYTATDLLDPLTEQVILYAQWIEKKYNINYVSNGGSLVSGETVNEKERFTEPKNPTRPGNDFEGWYIDEKLTEEYDFSTPATKDITVYAKWNKRIVPNEKEYTINYVPNGGSSVSDETVNENERFTEPKYPTMSGYNFEGWYIDEKLTEEYDFSTPATKDITVYAKWNKRIVPNEKEYTINYVPNGGSSVSDETVNKNERFAEPKDPTRSGYNFEGWYIDEKLTEEYDFSTPATKNITVYAKWSPSENKVDNIVITTRQEIPKSSSTRSIPVSIRTESTKNLPSTGERKTSIFLSFMGSLIIIIVSILVIKKKRLRNK